MEMPAEVSVVTAYDSLYYTTQDVRKVAVHRNPDMRIDGYATLERETLNYYSKKCLLFPPSIPCRTLLYRGTQKKARVANAYAFTLPSGAAILRPGSSNHPPPPPSRWF